MMSRSRSNLAVILITAIPAQRCWALIGRSVAFRYYPSNRFLHHHKVKEQLHQFSLHKDNIPTKRRWFGTHITSCNSLPLSHHFVDEVTSFLDDDGIYWRQLSRLEIQKVLELYVEQSNLLSIDEDKSVVLSTNDRVYEIMALLEDHHAILAVGKGIPMNNNGTKSNHQPYSFILNLCPTTNLDEIHATHQKYKHNSSVAQAVAAYAWLNAHLTNAFFNKTSIVHLHQDVWARSPHIVRSRLRSKCGMFDQRIYARKTIVKRITKSQYIPFLEENHLWGATSAKFAYGLFLKPALVHVEQSHNNDNNNSQDEMPLAVATFSSKRKVDRSSKPFHSFELLRFCTKLDTTVVGGLTKLVAAFVKEIKSRQSETDEYIDIITSIDRDFGSNSWPNFEQMEVMDPLPMFVGTDGIRRHAVGAGLTPLEQSIGSSNSMTASMLLRAGLPDSVLCQLDQDASQNSDNRDTPWQTVAKEGFCPVFDSGVERLMMVVDGDQDERTKTLWDNSMPRYVKDHYSSNRGVESMLHCIRENKNLTQ